MAHVKEQNSHVILKTLMLLFTIYSIHFNFLPFSPRILVLAIVLGMYLLKRSAKIERNTFIFIFECLVILSYSFFVVNFFNSQLYGATIVTSYAFNFLIFVGVFPVLSYELFENENDFCKCLFYASIIQSLIVIASAFIPAVRELLQAIQEIDFSRYNYRIFGLGIAGAGGSVYLFCGFLAGTYILLKSSKLYWWTILLYLINFFAIILVGRTGFYCACIIVFIAFLLMEIRKRRSSGLKLITKIVFVAITLIPIFIFASLYFESDIKVLLYTIERLDAIFQSRSALTALQDMNENLPDLGLKSIVGTGVVRGITEDGLRIWHDGGYIQRYASLGIVFAVFSYLSLCKYLVNCIKIIPSKETSYFLYACIIIMFIIEYKEPFIYMLALPYTIIMISRLSNKSVLYNNSIKGASCENRVTPVFRWLRE